MKTTSGLPVTADTFARFLRTRIRATGHGLALVALVVLAVVTTGASSRNVAQVTQASRTFHTFLTAPTSAETGCSSDSALCLNDLRFLVEATWTTPDGTSGSGHPVPLTSDSGYFWFFDPNNVELTVKALNGCGFNGHYWLFAGGLTNVEVTMTVTDTVTGEIKTYSNLQGNAFQPIIDTAAFGNCTAAALSAGNPEEPQVEAPVTAQALAAARASSAGGCAQGDTVLCVRDRFQVEATWQSASGASGPAYAVPLTSESGYFWFFSPSNVEMIVKTLDACGLKNGNWFFAAGMTDVGVQLRVTDTFTGEVKTYANPLGAPFLPIQDTAAFAFCPTATPTPTVTPTPTPTRTPTVRRGTPTSTHTPKPTPTRAPGPGQVQTYSASFSPASITVHVGDTVTWVWVGIINTLRSTTSGTCQNSSPYLCSPDGIWDSGLYQGPHTFSHTFLQAGTFHYFNSVLTPCFDCHRPPFHAFHAQGDVIVVP